MNAIADRLKEAREELGLTQPQLAAKAGVSPGAIGNIEAGIRKRPRELLAIAKAADVRPEWLQNGTPPKRPQKTPSATSTNGFENVMPADIGATRVPVITYIQAGALSEVVDPFPPGAADEWLYTDLPVSDGTFALEIAGYSMADEFQPGDRVIIDPALQPHPGDFVAAQNGAREATFKKYRPRGMDENGNTVFELVPLNEDYPTLRSDTESLRVIGVMVEHRKYRRRR